MVPYQAALDNEQWRRANEDEMLRQTLSLGGITLQDWYDRAFRAQEFQRINDAMMLGLATPLLQSLLGSVYSGQEGAGGADQSTLRNLLSNLSQQQQAQGYDPRLIPQE